MKTATDQRDLVISALVKLVQEEYPGGIAEVARIYGSGLLTQDALTADEIEAVVSYFTK